MLLRAFNTHVTTSRASGTVDVWDQDIPAGHHRHWWAYRADAPHGELRAVAAGTARNWLAAKLAGWRAGLNWNP